MLRERLREYFSFTRKERIGFLVLIFLILGVFVLPFFFNSPSSIADREALDQFKKQIASAETGEQDDSSSTKNYHQPNKDNPGEKESQQERKNSKEELFFFDPNSISTDQWRKLGIKEKTIYTIQHYLSKGGRFKTAEDLKKIYGMNKGDCKRLMPYVRIEVPDHVPEIKTNYPVHREDSNLHSSVLRKLDLNVADSADFLQLKGIGSKLAARIIHFRDRLGGFYSVDQVGETFGLPDSIFQKIRPFLVLTTDSVRKIDIDSADVSSLAKHPYIGWTVAKAIVQYRNQHGLYQSTEELLQIAIISQEKFRKFAPYLKVNKSQMPVRP